MNSDLYWLPPPNEQKKNNIIGYLKYEIARYYENDYNGGNMEQTASEELIPFLKGIIAVGTQWQKEDAENLIAAIKKYGEVQLIIGW